MSIQTEDYLERIQNLIERKGYARVSDIAEDLQLSPSTVSNMIRRLASLGLIEYEPYRGLSLTEKGRAVAQSVQARHAILADFLQVLGINPEEAFHDVEGIEHFVSDSTLGAIEALTRTLKEHPAVLGKVLKRSRSAE